MKKANSTIFASIFAISLVTMVLGGVTMAYFSAGPEATGPYVMNTATMTMAVQSSPVTFTNLKPGDTFGPIDIVIRNTGTMHIWSLATSITLTGSDALADMIEITQWDEFLPGYDWQDNLGVAQHFHTLVEDGVAPLTLLEVAQSYSTGRGEPYYGSGDGHTKVDQWGNYKMYFSDAVTGAGYDQHSGYAIQTFSSTGQDYIMRFSFKFSEDAGDDLQTKTVTFSVSFLGMQDYVSQRP